VDHLASGALVLTGIVTTNDVVVSPQIAGRIEQLNVNEGDEVKAGQMIAVLDSGELEQEEAYYSAGAATRDLAGGREPRQPFATAATGFEIKSARPKPTLRPAEAQQMAARAESTTRKSRSIAPSGCRRKASSRSRSSIPQKTAYQVAQSKIDSLAKQIDAQRAAVELARFERRPGGDTAQPARSEPETAGCSRGAAREGGRPPWVYRAARSNRRRL
jgi:multidrug efflux pump subunit AcrA (membrane-fusion protein)